MSDTTQKGSVEKNKKQPRPSEKRQVHNELERRRKDRINEWISKIGELLPGKESHKQSKISLLEQTVKYIKQLASERDKLLSDNSSDVIDCEINKLKKEIALLSDQNALYQKLLQQSNISLNSLPHKQYKYTDKFIHSNGVLSVKSVVTKKKSHEDKAVQVSLYLNVPCAKTSARHGKRNCASKVASEKSIQNVPKPEKIAKCPIPIQPSSNAGTKAPKVPSIDPCTTLGTTAATTNVSTILSASSSSNSVPAFIISSAAIQLSSNVGTEAPIVPSIEPPTDGSTILSASSFSKSAPLFIIPPSGVQPSSSAGTKALSIDAPANASTILSASNGNKNVPALIFPSGGGVDPSTNASTILSTSSSGSKSVPAFIIDSGSGIFQQLVPPSSSLSLCTLPVLVPQQVLSVARNIPAQVEMVSLPSSYSHIMLSSFPGTQGIVLTAPSDRPGSATASAPEAVQKTPKQKKSIQDMINLHVNSPPSLQFLSANKIIALVRKGQSKMFQNQNEDKRVPAPENKRGESSENQSATSGDNVRTSEYSNSLPKSKFSLTVLIGDSSKDKSRDCVQNFLDAPQKSPEVATGASSCENNIERPPCTKALSSIDELLKSKESGISATALTSKNDATSCNFDKNLEANKCIQKQTEKKDTNESDPLSLDPTVTDCNNGSNVFPSLLSANQLVSLSSQILVCNDLSGNVQSLPNSNAGFQSFGVLNNDSETVKESVEAATEKNTVVEENSMVRKGLSVSNPSDASLAANQLSDVNSSPHFSFPSDILAKATESIFGHDSPSGEVPCEDPQISAARNPETEMHASKSSKVRKCTPEWEAPSKKLKSDSTEVSRAPLLFLEKSNLMHTTGDQNSNFLLPDKTPDSLTPMLGDMLKDASNFDQRSSNYFLPNESQAVDKVGNLNEDYLTLPRMYFPLLSEAPVTSVSYAHSVSLCSTQSGSHKSSSDSLLKSKRKELLQSAPESAMSKQPDCFVKYTNASSSKGLNDFNVSPSKVNSGLFNSLDSQPKSSSHPFYPAISSVPDTSDNISKADTLSHSLCSLLSENRLSVSSSQSKYSALSLISDQATTCLHQTTSMYTCPKSSLSYSAESLLQTSCAEKNKNVRYFSRNVEKKVDIFIPPMTSIQSAPIFHSNYSACEDSNSVAKMPSNESYINDPLLLSHRLESTSKTFENNSNIYGNCNFKPPVDNSKSSESSTCFQPPFNNSYSLKSNCCHQTSAELPNDINLPSYQYEKTNFPANRAPIPQSSNSNCINSYFFNSPASCNDGNELSAKPPPSRGSQEMFVPDPNALIHFNSPKQVHPNRSKTKKPKASNENGTNYSISQDCSKMAYVPNGYLKPILPSQLPNKMVDAVLPSNPVLPQQGEAFFNFQHSNFAMNPLPRPPPSTPIMSTTHPVPNFNLSNILPDMGCSNNQPIPPKFPASTQSQTTSVTNSAYIISHQSSLYPVMRHNSQSAIDNQNTTFTTTQSSSFQNTMHPIPFQR